MNFRIKTDDSLKTARGAGLKTCVFPYLPSRKKVRQITDIFEIIITGEGNISLFGKKMLIRILHLLLKRQIRIALSCDKKCAGRLSTKIINKLPDISKSTFTDAEAIYRGDPAATSPYEVILSYPGLYATLVYRVAHAMHIMDIRYIPRIMTEYAHERTGIDIHPGATIGESFCIDHGTGVVVGETAVIGNRVKIYQGVTLGAKSFETNDDGSLVRGKKRHPTIGDDCIIYANATILGGDTVIGNGCTVGGNVWLTHSVADGQKVYYK